MTIDLETDVRAVFAVRAAELPATALTRVAAVDYRPRTARLTTPARVGVGAGVLAGAATAGAALSVVLGGAAPAYAGWSATPTTTSRSANPPAATDTSCTSQLASMGNQSGGTNPTAWQPVLTDLRGPFTIELFQAGNDYAACFTGPSFTEVNQLSMPSGGSGGAQSGALSVRNQAGGTASGGSPTTGQAAVILEGTSSGDLNQVVENHLTTTSDGPYTLIDGRVANGVTGVTLVLDDSQDVVTTVADGWFVAWWPGADQTATSAQVTKASGTTSEPFVPMNKVGAPGTCTNTSGTSHCVSTGAGQVQTGNSGNSGNIARPGNSGSTVGTGPGPTAPSKP